MRNRFKILLSLLIASALIFKSTTAKTAIYDIIIKNGRIIDGTGNPWYKGDIAVKDGKIVRIGSLSDEKSKKIIDASGRVVSPGFIDIHTHLDSILKAPPTLK